MNKQEALKELNWMKKMNEDVPTFEEWSEGRKSGIDETLQDAIDIVNKIDEPEKKPTVPQFVADWYEDNKYTFEYSIAQLIEDSCNNEIEDDDLRLWFGYDLDNDKPIQTLVNMHQFGYKVYEEKLYTAKLKSTCGYLNYNPSFEDLNHFKVSDEEAKGDNTYHFTKEELVKYHAWKNEAYEVNEVNNDN